MINRRAYELDRHILKLQIKQAIEIYLKPHLVVIIFPMGSESQYILVKTF